MLRNALCLFTLCVIVLLVFLPSYSQMQDLRQKNLDYARKIEVLEQEKVRLEEEKRRLEEDPAYLEKVARENMGLIKEGEVIYKRMPVNMEE